ncbi:transcription factor bHLH128-like [Malania oleifera]|uniref:transcription factor bHLH128-like n=1 Tax=Malania oleifera TaxID=397392 RepID=UPI0025AE11C2|nr:transcription factor bHLH128-like [Malania oleifera]
MYPCRRPLAQGGGLTRYGSAPESLLTAAIDSALESTARHFSPLESRTALAGQYFSGDRSSLTSDSSCKVSSLPSDPHQYKGTTTKAAVKPGLQRSYGLNEVDVGDFATATNLKSAATCDGGGGSSSLIRHSSSPAGFLSHLAADTGGFFLTRGSGGYNNNTQCGSRSSGGNGISRLKSQMSFTGQESLSQISEGNENIVDCINSENGHRKSTHSYATASASFAMDSWDDSTATNSIVFSAPPTKRAKLTSGDILDGFSALESQFSLPETALEMAAVEHLLQIPEDSIPCKVRAKRGCATHPRSIAERERRTRITGKLKKLQELVPNMDKQTSYADMLDLAVHHIKSLQDQVQKINEELDYCTCGCKNA